MANVTPGYTFLGTTDPITYQKLNLLATPTVTVGAGEVTTSMIADNAVTFAKMQLATGGGFVGRTTATSGVLSFITLSDGNITWPSNGIAMSNAVQGGELSMGATNVNRMKIAFDPTGTDGTIEVGQSGDTGIQYGSGDLGITAGRLSFNRGNGSGATLFVKIDTNIQLGTAAALATTATAGFPVIPTCAGAPTGAFTPATDMAGIVIDTTNNRIYARYGGAWKYAALT